MDRGRRAVLLAGRCTLLVATLLMVIGLAGQAAAGGPRQHHSTAAARVPTWTAEQAIAALSTAAVVKIPGSPAVFDEQQLTEAIGSGNVKILAVPFAQPERPTLSRMDDATSALLDEVETWASSNDVDLVTVVGLQINLGGILEQRPDSVPDLQRIMLRSELTTSLLFSIAYEQLGRDAADELGDTAAVEPAVPADPATTALIGAALEADSYYAGPGVDAPEGAFDDWQDVGPDRVVRVALLAAPAADEPFVDQLTPLAARFPDDIVVVVTGRWVQIAGPEQALLDAAVLYGYGAFYNRVAQNDVPLANLVLGMLRRVGELRGGSVSDQQGPQTDDPVAGVSPALPWLFVGTAVVAVAALFLLRQRRTTRSVTAARDDRRERARSAARLAVVADQLLQLDGLARDDPARSLLTRATERFGTARDLILGQGDLRVARSALDEASALTARAAVEVQVPLADRAIGAFDDSRPTGSEHR